MLLHATGCHGRFVAKARLSSQVSYIVTDYIDIDTNKVVIIPENESTARAMDCGRATSSVSTPSERPSFLLAIPSSSPTVQDLQRCKKLANMTISTNNNAIVAPSIVSPLPLPSSKEGV
eukprot:scaffold4275_cov179-Ochromonas_danica.AAC.5